MKANCYECQYRGTVPGDAHSCCKHPLIATGKGNPMAEIMAIFASIGRVPGFTDGAEKLNVRGNAHGIRSGWFNWPYNFDPIWLDNCDGFTAKETKEVKK